MNPQYYSHKSSTSLFSVIVTIGLVMQSSYGSLTIKDTEPGEKNAMMWCFVGMQCTIDIHGPSTLLIASVNIYT